MKNEYAVVITACPNEETAKKIIDALLENKLAACIQLFPINSYYSWKGEICNEKEIALFIKCNQNHYAKIEETIIKNHSYEVPEIVMLPVIGAFNKYLSWIDEVSG
ncbi:MAG: divalent-cation tolerance protein CutA [Treponema sp.]|nr:divalent-cation tolerance protein CutA [Treponema sp.]